MNQTLTHMQTNVYIIFAILQLKMHINFIFFIIFILNENYFRTYSQLYTNHIYIINKKKGLIKKIILYESKIVIFIALK